ncbi:hypothetical protein EVJ50_12335 [Synechococcus sp. RSCCF101]|uniref:ArnT family glycosyltransferase n=1 Tax=Synechococcus sp. RSCCF101 TaxID=2511069 RepID=UPI001246DF0A|nr:glycosyltransferase family 39 protein [Synechococcus sp. RSCCF101]QEY32901.1 hypothetical protein EVJ50_12335 [Synechococcus sp. RSCCF101]
MSPASRGTAPPLWIPLGLGLALRLVNLQAPILGVHSWRQADTAAIARNYLEQGMALWLPRVDWSGAGPGFAETDFPIYSWAVALLYQLSGVQVWLARGLSVLASVLTIVLVARIGERLLGARAGWWGALSYAFLPIPVFYGRTVQPEATLMLLAAWCLERALAWRDRGRRRDLLFCWLGFSGCLLVKLLPVVWLGLPLLLLLSWDAPSWRRIPLRPLPWLFGLSAALVTAAWYAHAHQLGQSTGLSFGFWGAEANRYSWIDLASPRYWGDLLLRITVRNLAVIGLPLLGRGSWLP